MPTAQEVKTMARIKQRYGKYIAEASKLMGVPQEHLYNIIYTESGGKADAVGGAGDTGLTQMIPSTALMVAEQLGYKDFKDSADLQRQLVDNPGLNILFGAKHYKDALDMSPDDPVLAYSRYNAGRAYPDKSDFHNEVFEKISARDLTGDDQISQNAARFAANYGIIGYDPYGGQSMTERPSQANLEPLAANRDIHRDPYADTRSVFGDNVTVGREAIPSPERWRAGHELGKMIFKNPVGRAVTGAIQAGTFGYAPTSQSVSESYGPPEGFAEQAGDAVGNVAGMVGAMSATGLSGIGGFAAYGGLSKGNTEERLLRMRDNAALALGLGVAGRLTQAGIGAVSKKGAEEFARAMQHRPVKAAADIPVFTGLELAHGKPIGESLAAGVGGAVGAGIAPHGPIKRVPLAGEPAPNRRLSRTPAEREVPGVMDKVAQKGLAEAGEIETLRKARAEPIPGLKISETLNGSRNEQGRYDIEGVVSSLAAGGIDGHVDPAVRKAIKKQVVAENRAMPKGMKKLNVSEETDRRALRETMDPALVDMVENHSNPKLALSKRAVRSQAYLSPLRWWQARGDGKIGYENVIDKVVTRANQELQEFTMDIGDQFTQVKVEWAKKHGIENMPKAKRNAITEKLEAGDLSDPAVADLARIYKTYQPLLDKANLALGGRGAGEIENYAGRHFEAEPGRLGRIKASVIDPIKKGGEPEPQRDPSNKSPLQNPSRLRRTGSIENPEMDPLKRLDKYSQDLANDIGHNTAIKYNNNVARFLEVNGYKAAAESLRKYSSAIYKQQKYGGPLEAQKVGKLPGISTVNDALSWTRRRLYESVFPLNLLWTFTVQPSSSAQTPMNSGAKNAAAATRLMLSPEFRSFVDQNIYAAGVKTRGKGSLFRRAAEDKSVLMNRDVTNMSARELALDFASSLGAAMEKNLGYYSAAARFLMGKQLGLKGRELIDHMNDGIMKDQSMYDPYNRSEFLKSKEFNNLLPFKSFMLEIAENVAEQYGGTKVGHGQYRIAEKKGVSQKKHNITGGLSLAGGIILANLLNETVKGRPVYSPSSIPGYDELTGSGMAEGGTMAANTLRQFQRGRSRAARGVREENPALIAQGLVRSVGGFLPAGAQLRRLVDTYAATQPGTYPFRLKTKAEIAHSAIVGPSGTMKGREYWDRRKGRGEKRSLEEELFLKFREGLLKQDRDN